MSLKRYIFFAALPGVVVGVILTGLTLRGWFAENLHGNFYNPATGAVDWQLTITLGVFWFTIVFLAVSVVVAIGIAAYRGLRLLFLRLRNAKS